jgi:hypothetical protein
MRPRLPAWAILLVLSVVLAQGIYAAWLNKLYYARFAPFFDSMAYTNMLADVLAKAQSGGLRAGLQAALGQSTVSLPWLITAILAPLLPYSRLVGVCIQEFWMALLGVSVLIYWRRYRRASLSQALLWTLPPLSFTVIYRANGGVSDFRMDLSLYLLFALAMVWYLITRETLSRTPWVLSGLFIALCIMNRATAPAYLGMTLAPVLAARWWLEPGRRWWLVKRVAAFWLPAAAIGLLPVVKNWTYIHYYYFVWGAAPTAHLPITKSAIHIAAAGLNMGIGVFAASALLLILQVPGRKPLLWRQLDWPLIWIAAAPGLLLVFTGAGPNPFSAMPMIFGSLLFSMAPFRDRVSFSDGANHRAQWASILLVVVCAYQAVTGYLDHIDDRGGNAPSMAALRQGLNEIQAECQRLGLRRAEFLTSHLSDFQATALGNVLIYEYAAIPRGGGFDLPNGLTLAASYEGRFSPAVPLSWTEVPAPTEDTKFAYLVTQARDHVDFFFLPDDPSIDWMERHLPYNYMNLKIRRLKRELLASGAWQPLGPALRITNNETVNLFVARRLTAKP